MKMVYYAGKIIPPGYSYGTPGAIPRNTTDPRLHYLDWTYSKCDTIEKHRKAERSMGRIHRMEERRYAEYKRKLFYIMEKYVERWWD